MRASHHLRSVVRPYERGGMCGYEGREHEGVVPKAARGGRAVHISLHIDVLSGTLGNGRDAAGTAGVAGRPAEEHARVER